MKGVVTIATIILIGVTSSAQKNSQANNQNKMDIETIRQSIKNLFAGADERNWGKVQNVMAKAILLDYTSMTGGTPSTQTPEQITAAWAAFLPGFDKTNHSLSGFQIKVKGSKANAQYSGKADHFIGGEVWTVEGNYDTELQKENDRWFITKHKFNIVTQSGNTNLPFMAKQLLNQKKITTMKKVKFESGGLTLTGNMFFPENFDATKKYPAIVVSGSWTTVKEQMAGLYAERLAKEGFITLAFDFRNFGESEGQPRFYESPALKKEDLKNAVTFLSHHPQVNPERIGALGICAGAMHTLMAASEDKRIKAVVTTASWLQDSEAVKLFYGGEEGVQSRINAGQASKKKFAESGAVDYVLTVSETDPTAAMYGSFFGYYLDPKRGAVPQWSADKFAVMSWVDWLTLDPMPSAKKLTASTLMIHSDGAVLPQYTKNYFADIASTDKKLYWMETDVQSPLQQIYFYDQEPEVSESVAEATKWFKTKLQNLPVETKEHQPA